MWSALAVASVATIMAVLSFLSRGRAIKRAARWEAQVIEGDELIEALLEEIEAITLGDHGLEHDDMRDVLFPPLHSVPSDPE